MVDQPHRDLRGRMARHNRLWGRRRQRPANLPQRLLRAVEGSQGPLSLPKVRVGAVNL